MVSMVSSESAQKNWFESYVSSKECKETGQIRGKSGKNRWKLEKACFKNSWKK